MASNHFIGGYICLSSVRTLFLYEEEYVSSEQVINQNNAVMRLVLSQLFNRLVHLRHWHEFNLWAYLVSFSKGEHCSHIFLPAYK